PVGAGRLGHGRIRIEGADQLGLAQLGQHPGVVAAHDAEAGDADLQGLGFGGGAHAKLRMAATMRSWLASSRSACIGRLMTTSFLASVTARPCGPRPWPA